MPATKLLLYNFNQPEKYKIYNIQFHNLADTEKMQSLGYPNPRANRQYVLYEVGVEHQQEKQFDVVELKKQYAPTEREGSPFFINM